MDFRTDVAAIGLTVILVGCGARTGLDVGDGEGGGSTTSSTPRSCPGSRTYSRIGILGAAGTRDESAFVTFLAKHGSLARTQTDGSELTASVLDGFDLVVLDDLVRDYSPDEARVFERWVDAGGGAISLTGYVNGPTDTSRPNSLFGDLGVAYVQPLLADSQEGRVTSFAVHPLTRGLTHARFLGGYAVTHTSAATEIAFLNGDAVAEARRHGCGRVYLWGDEWVEFTSEWNDPQTERFWSDALAWLSHRD